MKNAMTETKPVAVFMMGGPASGKSTVRKSRYASLPVIDCDEIKATFPGFDPKNPQEFHEASSIEATRRVYALLGEGVSFVFDGTGSTAEKYVAFIRSANAAGFTTEICYVTTDLATALKRNQERARTVPEQIVREKHSMIATSFEIVAGYADTVNVVRN